MDHTTVQRRPRRAITLGARRHCFRAMAAVFLLLALLATAGPAAADSTGSYTNPSPPDTPTCPAGTYTVPDGTRYVQITADGGAGAAGSPKVFLDGLNPGLGGSGALVQAIFPVTAGQTLSVVVGRKGAYDAADVETTYSGWPDGGQNPTNNGGGGGSSFVTTQPLVASTGCQDIATSHLDRSKMLLLAGGGGGGGNAGTTRSGGNGGNAGARSDFGGNSGSDGDHGALDCSYGRGGAGASPAAAGAGGAGDCLGSPGGQAGSGFYGGGSPLYGIGPFTFRAGASGAGGGGWYGGGSGSEADAFLGGGGGGAGASYASPAARRSSVHQAVDDPQVHIEPLDTPTTTASGDSAGTPLADSYTASPAIWFTAQGGMPAVKTYYALDTPACGPTNLATCSVYGGTPFSVGNGLHTLTYFSIDGWGLDELVHTHTFVVGVPGATLGSGTNPSATAGGAAGTAGSVGVSATGSGTVGAAVYGTNPAGPVTFNSNSAFVDVVASGGGLTGLTITDCDLNGGTEVYWYSGTAWALASDQTYDPATKCVTIAVSATTSPSLSQMTGTVFAAGTPPWILASASTPDFQRYTAGTWTNQSVTVVFDCSMNAKSTDRVTLASDGQNQSASGTCTDGLGQTASTTFTGINIDKTAPTASPIQAPTANGAGWNTTDVTVTWHWADNAGGAGLDPANCPASSTSTGEGGAIMLSATCADRTGNLGHASATVKVDKTAPTVAYTGNAPTYTADQTVNITCTATDPTPGSGLDPKATRCANITGPAYAFPLGTNTATATATDLAGNPSTPVTVKFVVTVNAASLGTVIDTLVSDPSVAASLKDLANQIASAPNAGAKKNALNAYTSLVNAQTGKSITPANAATLIKLAQGL